MKLLVLLICGCIFAQPSLGSSKPDLVFVVDDSGNVLPEVKAQVTDFFDELSKVEKTSVGNYTFILISEKAKDPIKSKDVKSFNQTLANQVSRDIRRGFGVPCDGNTLSAIKSGLASIAPKSVIIVFTDAVPGDKDKLADIKKDIAATQSKILFVLVESASCSVPHSTEYQEIALASNGQIFKILEGRDVSISQILRSIQPSIGPQRVDLLAASGEPKATQTFAIPLSEIFSDVLITVSANNSFTLNLNDPANEDVTNDCIKADTQAICRVDAPIMGNYTINLENISTTYAVRASATSNLTFHYGFQTLENEDSAKAKQIFSLPVKDANNTLIVKFDDPSLIMSLSSVDIVSVDGVENQGHFNLIPALNNTFTDSPSYGVYYAFLKAPESSVHLKINGMADNGKEFQVITPVAIHASSGHLIQPNFGPVPDKEQLFAGNAKDNVGAKNISYIPWEELMHEKPKTKNASNSISSSFFMTSFALLFLMMKKICV